MEKVLYAGEIKEVDRFSIESIGIPSLVLMERAAYSVLELIISGFTRDEKILIICGNGNNGADGVAIGRMLFVENFSVEIFLAGNIENASKDFIQQLDIVKKIGVPIIGSINKNSIDDYDLIVDALFGVGLSRNIEGEFADIIKWANKCIAKKIAVDIPSGLCADTGRIMGIAFESEFTVTFGKAKAGMLIYNGIECCGEIIVNNIGFPQKSYEIIEDAKNSRKWFLKADDLCVVPKRKKYSNKGTYGKILVIAGSQKIYGAAELCAAAAYASGAGLVKVITNENNRRSLQEKLPEVLIETYVGECQLGVLRENISWASVVCLGPGIDTDQSGIQICKNAIEISAELNKKIVIDADAINVISKNKSLLELTKNIQTVFTPHLMEMSRITDIEIEYIKENLIKVCENFATENNNVCVLKDAHSVISDGENTFINVTGNAAMAKGGTGDVLAGIISGLIAMGLDNITAASVGALLHGIAGEKASEKKGIHSMLASDIVVEIGGII